MATIVREFNEEDARRYRMIQDEVARLDELTEINAAFRAGREEGHREGAINVLVSLVKDGKITVSKASEKAEMTEAEFRKLLTSNG